jgi:WD40 repeat protein
MLHRIVWIAAGLAAAALPGARVANTFSMPDATLLFGNYNELRIVTPDRVLVVNPPVDRGYNRSYFAIPSLSARGDRVAWGFSTAWEERRLTDRARFAMGLASTSEPKWTSYGDFDSVGDAAFSPDGSRVAFVAKQQGQRRLMLFDVATEMFVTGPYQRGMPERSHVSWSPDATRLASEIQRGDRPSIVAVIDLKSREMHALGEGSNPRWSPIADWIAYYNDDKCFLIHSDGSGLKEVMTLTGARNFGWGGPVWSPDGTRLLLNVTKDGGPLLDVVLLDLRTGQSTTQARSALPVFGWAPFSR